MKTGNLFSAIPAVLPEEIFEDLLVGEGFRVERIVSKGHASPENFWYDQPENEWVVVLQGEARLQIEGHETSVELTKGMYINLPAHVKHRVEWTTEAIETIWLAIFY